MIEIKGLSQLTDRISHLVQSHLWLKILLAALMGIGLGIFFSDTEIIAPSTKDSIINWVALPGSIFLGLIQMIMVPLVFASIILGIATSENSQMLKKIGTTAGIYFLITTTASIIIGILIASFLNPGSFIDSQLVTSITQQPITENITTDTQGRTNVPSVILNLLPQNPLNSIVQGQMLEIVVFSILFGIALVGLKRETAAPLLNLLSSLQQASMTIVGWAMKLAPIAVFGLIFKLSASVGLQVLSGLTAYVATVFMGLICVILFYCTLVLIVTKRNPFSFLNKIKELQLLAFSTSSSASVMPLSIKTAEDKFSIKKSVSQFIIPLGATINMDGTALYQGIATVFLAQVYDIRLSLFSLALIVVTAVGASIGTPGTPGVGIVILAGVLESVGIPTSGIALIIGVDRILDMGRTVVNVTGDLSACLVVDKLVDETE